MEKIKYTELTNPFEHICCGCGLTHDVYIKIMKNGGLAFSFKGNLKRTIEERKAGRYEFNCDADIKKIAGILRQIGTIRNDKEMGKVIKIIKNIKSQ